MIAEPQSTNDSLPGGAASSNEAWPGAFVVARRAAVLGTFAIGIVALLGSRVPVCPVVNLVGQPCPGCGLTRATLACLHGHFAEAAHLHPLVFVATPLVVVCAVLAARAYLKTGRAYFTTGQSRIIMPPLKLLYVALIALWLARFFGAFGGAVAVDPSLFSRIF